MKFKFLVLAAILTLPFAAKATEPAFCDPSKFSNYEMKKQVDGITRLHIYQIGNLKIAGMGVGTSDQMAVENLANELGSVPKSEKSCTWYFNEGNADAERAFVHKNLPGPYFWANKSKVMKAYSSDLNGVFDSDPVNMVQCAEKYNYIGEGCNSQKHRGPSVFAMILSFAGCTPEHSTKIANNIWGTNHVPVSTREAIAKLAYDWGSQRPESRKRLQDVMTSK